MSQPGIALIGLGRAGSFHLASLRSIPDVRLCCVYDVDQERSAQVAAQAGCRSAAAAEDAIGADDVDAVLIATPTQTHHAYVLAALRAGKPVLSEKPLGTSLADIDDCFAQAARAGLPLLVAFQRRFDPSFAELVSGAHGGGVGELQFIRSASRDNPVPSIDYIRTSGGIFHDCLVHDFDMVCHIARNTPVEVFAFGSSFIPEIGAVGDLDNVAVSLRFGNGLLATVDANRRSVYGYDQRIEIFGSSGMIQAENRARTTVVHSHVDGSVRPPVDHSFPTRYRDAYRAELECFIDCVRGRREVPITRDEVRRSWIVAEAAHTSWREGRPIQIDREKRVGPEAGRGQ